LPILLRPVDVKCCVSRRRCKRLAAYAVLAAKNVPYFRTMKAAFSGQFEYARRTSTVDYSVDHPAAGPCTHCLEFSVRFAASAPRRGMPGGAPRSSCIMMPWAASVAADGCCFRGAHSRGLSAASALGEQCLRCTLAADPCAAGQFDHGPAPGAGAGCTRRRDSGGPQAL